MRRGVGGATRAGQVGPNVVDFKTRCWPATQSVLTNSASKVLRAELLKIRRDLAAGRFADVALALDRLVVELGHWRALPTPELKSAANALRVRDFAHVRRVLAQLSGTPNA